LSCRLGALTSEEAAARGDATLVVPLGSTEQHGPHLPLDTDTRIARALAGALADARPGAVVLAPALAYGSSGEHAGFAGTLSIGQAALELLVVELGRDAAASFPRVLFLCAHGGNAEPLRRAERTLRAEGRDVRAFLPAWPGDAHAGRTETSLMLALAPELVRGERARAGPAAPLDQLMAALRSGGVRAVSPSGVLGDPSGASAAEGRVLLRTATERLGALLDDWVSRRASSSA
jgi:creatinine amidohydrolase